MPANDFQLQHGEHAGRGQTEQCLCPHLGKLQSSFLLDAPFAYLGGSFRDEGYSQ